MTGDRHSVGSHRPRANKVGSGLLLIGSGSPGPIAFLWRSAVGADTLDAVDG